MSRLLDEMHESMTGLHKAGLLSMDDMRKFDAACLPTVKQYTPAQIKKNSHQEQRQSTSLCKVP